MTAFFRATTVLLLLLPTSFCFEGFDFVFKSIPDKTPRALLSNHDGSVFSQLPESALTFCVYVYLENVHGETATLVSYSSRNTGWANELYLEAENKSSSYTALSIHGEKATSLKTPALNAWTHVCCSWSSSSGQAQIFFNGTKIVDEAGVQKGSTIGGNGYFVLGQDQDVYDGNYDPRQGVKGRMTQFNLWDRALTEAEVKETMSNNLNGEIVAWANSSWQFSGGIMIEKTTAPVNTTSSGKVQKTQCKNVEHTFTSPYDLETGFEDGIPNEVTGTLKNVDIPEMKEFSICFYIHDELNAYPNQPVSYKNTEGEPVITFGASSTPPKVYFGVGNNNAELTTTEINLAIRPKSIFHLCETWSSTTGEVTIYNDGAVMRKFKNISKDYTVPGNGKLVITQEQYAPLDKESVTKGFRYKLTDFYMWDRLLTDAEVASFINCTGSVEGYLVDPSRSEWEVENRGCPPYSQVSPIESTNNILFKFNTKLKVVLSLQNVKHIEKLNKFSLCFWAYSETETPDVGIVIKVEEIQLNLENGLAFRVHDICTHFPDYSVAAGSWQHICLTWSGVEGGKTQLFVDGEKKGSAEGIGTGKSIPEGSGWYVANQQYAVPDKEDPTKGFDWKMTDLNVWNYVISEEEVKQAQQCSLVLGNVITAKSSTWAILG